METDSDKRALHEFEIKILQQRSYGKSNDCGVFKSSRFRHFIQNCNEMDRFLLAYGFDFLWRCAAVCWVVFLFQEISK